MKKGITFGAFDLFHAGHVLMLEEAKTVCDHLIVAVQTDPSLDRDTKNTPVQSIEEREIQVSSCIYVDEVIIYEREADIIEILKTIDWDVRILGEEYQDKPFTGREESIDKCYFNSRPHNFSSSELRKRVADKHFSYNKKR
jgi:glycerol-3-phosphate cytidylyltransferase